MPGWVLFPTHPSRDEDEGPLSVPMLEGVAREVVSLHAVPVCSRLVS